MPQRQVVLYILTNRRRTVLYVGVTGDLVRRLARHRAGTGAAFTRRYHADALVYVEFFDDKRAAMEREKKLKAGNRRSKMALIQRVNPEWKNLIP